MAECYTIPGQPFIPFTPGYVVETANFGWNAGGVSTITRTGDARTTFQMPVRCVGCFIGFAPVAGEVLDRNRITHGFYFVLNTVYRVRVVELGTAKTPELVYDLADEFQIQRIGGNVLFKINTETIYASSHPSTGEIVVATVLYASGDAAPGAT